METDKAVTVSFLAVAFGRLWHVFNMRDEGSGLLLNQVTRNPLVWGALALSAGLLLLAVYIPFLATALDIVQPGWSGWILIAAISLLPLVIGQTGKWIAYRFGH